MELMPTLLPTDGPVIAGNVYPKYTTRNPVARLLVNRFQATLLDLAGRTKAREIHEVGCGEGFLSMMLAAHGFTVRGSDLSPDAIAMARREAVGRHRAPTFRVADLYDLAPQNDSAEVVVCCEVLEHVPDPVRALDILAGLARPFLIVSVPREPLWRALNVVRGRYWRQLGNTPGHLQHWSTRDFVALLRQRVEVLECRTPIPWTFALCRTRPWD
jgi:2-polyprenyl-3-methyl-5-hydroxy-6-metoxy-1,4-benzoquinol methylase